MSKPTQGRLSNERRQRLPLFGSIAAACAAVLGGFFFWYSRPQAQPSDEPVSAVPQAVAAPAIPEGYVRRVTDGVYIPPEQQPKRWFAVMVENSAEAWPLSGIADARLVIEAPVEGSIPRLSAYFDDTQVEVKQIGPVRSLRPYYSDWARGFGAMVAHVGGSPEALAAVDTQRITSLNEFYWGRFFWRSLDRYAPHNVYTSVGLLNQGFDARGFKNPEMPMFSYTEQEPSAEARPQEQTVAIPFSSLTDSYTARWEYDPAANAYLRFQGSERAADADGKTVSAKNVVVMFADVRVIDDVGRRSIKTTGQGKTVLYRDGQSFLGTWEKESSTGSLRFLSEGGNEMAFNPGQTWIEAVPLSTQVR